MMPDDNQLLRLYIRLTPRQREVLQLVSQGLSNQQVGERLCIAPSVVAGHLTGIYGTLAVFEMYARPNRYVLISLYADFFRRHPLFKP
jgi:DNA-binding NarL/FixJ family response regulator